jgi:hypothetical protein
MAKTKHLFTTKHAATLLSGLTSETAWDRIEKEDKKGGYHSSYQAILDFAQTVGDNCSEKREHVLACATYGWMPTIMKNFNLEKSGIPRPIQRIKEANSKEGAISLIQEMGGGGIIKNSWVGASKFMHFLNPSFFPIWDTRVAEKFSEHCINHALSVESEQKKSKMPSAYNFANKKENYLKYTTFMLHNIDKKYEWLEPLSAKFLKTYNYRSTDLRLLELMLFYK